MCNVWVKHYLSLWLTNFLTYCIDTFSILKIIYNLFIWGYWDLFIWDYFTSLQSSSIQSLSRVLLFATPWTTARQASLSVTNSQSLPKLMSIESVVPSTHLILCRPLLLLPSIFLTSGSFQMSQLFTSDGQRIGVSGSASVLPMNTQDWFPLGWTGWNSLQSQGTLKSLLQHHSSKASVLQPSAFFIVLLSHPYMTTGKTIALARWTLVGKVMSLLLTCCLGRS